MEVLAGLVLLALLVALYFLPAIVAFNRELTNRWSVFVLNLLLGWTLVGWAIAMAMAASGVAPSGARSDTFTEAAPVTRGRAIAARGYYCRRCGSTSPVGHQFCDHCGAPLVTGATVATPKPAAVVGSETKKCPECAEQVKADARICRYCRHEFAPTD